MNPDSQFESLLQLEVDAGTALGCEMHDERLDCGIRRIGTSGPGDALAVTAKLQTVPGDVTGHYSVSLTGQHTSEGYESELEPWPGGAAPPARAARPLPGIRGPLAPQTLAEGTDPGDYVLLEGSEFLVQYSAGSLTGGFGVLLRVLPGSDVGAVSRAYAEQARQDDGSIDEQVTENDDSTVTVYRPRGGAGGYRGTVDAVDNDAVDDSVYYFLSND